MERVRMVDPLDLTVIPLLCETNKVKLMHTNICLLMFWT